MFDINAKKQRNKQKKNYEIEKLKNTYTILRQKKIAISFHMKSKQTYLISKTITMSEVRSVSMFVLTNGYS